MIVFRRPLTAEMYAGIGTFALPMNNFGASGAPPVTTVRGRQSLSLGSRLGIGIALLLTTLTGIVHNG